MNLGKNQHKCMLRLPSWKAALLEKKAGDLGFTKKSTGSRKKEVILPLYSAQVRHLWNAEFNAGLPSTGHTGMR